MGGVMNSKKWKKIVALVKTSGHAGVDTAVESVINLIESLPRCKLKVSSARG